MGIQNKTIGSRDELLGAIKLRLDEIGLDIAEIHNLDVRGLGGEPVRPFAAFRLCNVYLDDAGTLRGDLIGDPHAEPVTSFGMNLERMCGEDLKRLLDRLHSGKYLAVELTLEEGGLSKDTHSPSPAGPRGDGPPRKRLQLLHSLRRGA